MDDKQKEADLWADVFNPHESDREYFERRKRQLIRDEHAAMAAHNADVPGMPNGPCSRLPTPPQQPTPPG